MDIGGTTTDVGVLQQGFPRPASREALLAGVRINQRVPDILSIGKSSKQTCSVGFPCLLLPFCSSFIHKCSCRKACLLPWLSSCLPLALALAQPRSTYTAATTLLLPCTANRARKLLKYHTAGHVMCEVWPVGASAYLTAKAAWLGIHHAFHQLPLLLSTATPATKP